MLTQQQETMDTVELLNIMQNNPVTKSSFDGVYAADRLPKETIKKRPCGLITNLGKSNLPGSHWICIYLPSNRTNQPPELFDSFAVKPISQEFLDYMQRNNNLKKTIRVSNRQIQGDFSEICGQYCCLYLYYKCKNKTMSQFLDMFSQKK